MTTKEEASDLKSFSVEFYKYLQHEQLDKFINLLNDLPHTNSSSTAPYQEGRSYWVYLKYDY